MGLSTQPGFKIGMSFNPSALLVGSELLCAFGVILICIGHEVLSPGNLQHNSCCFVLAVFKYFVRTLGCYLGSTPGAGGRLVSVYVPLRNESLEVLLVGLRQATPPETLDTWYLGFNPLTRAWGL